MRAPRRVAAALAAATIIVTPAAASAATHPTTASVAAPADFSIPGTDCLQPPTPGKPSDWGGTFDDMPATKGTTTYALRGYGGYMPVSFDPGCLKAGASNAAGAVTGGAAQSDGNTTLAKWENAATLWMIGAAVQLTRLTLDNVTLWGVLDHFTSPIAWMSTYAFFAFVGLIVMLLSGWLLALSHRGDVAWTAGIVGRSVVIIAGALLCAGWALSIGAYTSHAISVVMGAVSSTSAQAVAAQTQAAQTGTTPLDSATTTNPGPTLVAVDSAADAVGSLLIDNIMQPVWQREMLGNNPDAIAKYARPLYEAGAFTRAEADAIRKNPGSEAAAVNAKKEQYKAVAAKIKAEYPAAYDVLAGNDTFARPMEGALGPIAAFLVIAPLVLLLVLICLARVVVQTGSALFPLVALVALVPAFQRHAYSTAALMAGSAAAGVAGVFGFVIFTTGALGGALQMPASLATRVIFFALLYIGMRVAWKRRGQIMQRIAVASSVQDAFDRFRGSDQSKDRSHDGERDSSGDRDGSRDSDTDTPDPGTAGGVLAVAAAASEVTQEDVDNATLSTTEDMDRVDTIPGDMPDPIANVSLDGVYDPAEGIRDTSDTLDTASTSTNAPHVHGDATDTDTTDTPDSTDEVVDITPTTWDADTPDMTRFEDMEAAHLDSLDRHGVTPAAMREPAELVPATPKEDTPDA